MTTEAGTRLLTWADSDARALPEFGFDTVAEAVAAIEAEARTAVLDHRPGIATDTDDSTWLDCSCGWDQQASKVDWAEHIEIAVASSVVDAVFHE